MLTPVSEGAFQMRVDRSASVSASVLLGPQHRRRHARREGRLALLSRGSGGAVILAVVVVVLVLPVLPRLFDCHRNVLFYGSCCCEDESDVLFLAELEQQLIRVGVVGACTPPTLLLDPLDRASAIPLPDPLENLVQLFQPGEQFGRQGRRLRGVRFGEEG